MTIRIYWELLKFKRCLKLSPRRYEAPKGIIGQDGTSPETLISGGGGHLHKDSTYRDFDAHQISRWRLVDESCAGFHFLKITRNLLKNHLKHGPTSVMLKNSFLKVRFGGLMRSTYGSPPVFIAFSADSQ